MLKRESTANFNASWPAFCWIMLKDDTLQTRGRILDEGAAYLDPGAEVSGWSITLVLKGVLSKRWRHRLRRVLFNDLLRVIHSHQPYIYSLFSLIINDICFSLFLLILLNITNFMDFITDFPRNTNLKKKFAEELLINELQV